MGEEIDMVFKLRSRPIDERTSENDRERTLFFADLMVEKYVQGREKHGIKSETTSMDPIEEAKKECIDLANYAMEVFYRLERLQEDISEALEAIEEAYNSA